MKSVDLMNYFSRKLTFQKTYRGEIFVRERVREGEIYHDVVTNLGIFKLESTFEKG